MAETNADGGDTLAPVIPLFTSPASAARSSLDPPPDPTWNPSRDDDPDVGIGIAPSDDRDDGSPDSDADAVELARGRLIRRLGRRGLSMAEATSSLIADGMDRRTADAVVGELVDRRWLDDDDLAEQLVHSAVRRKGEGRRAIAQTLAKRGIPRDVADAALASLPDDDFERALEFARAKARSMTRLDHDTALRRLTGQLARRGYPGSTAMNATKQALADEGIRASSVRFR